jgi:hypothetical protein
VHQDDQWSLAFFDVVEADAVDVGEAVIEALGIVDIGL